MNDFVLRRLRTALHNIRYGDGAFGDPSKRREIAYYRFCGYLEGLSAGRVISLDEYRRLSDLAADALIAVLDSPA